MMYYIQYLVFMVQAHYSSPK